MPMAPKDNKLTYDSDNAPASNNSAATMLLPEEDQKPVTTDAPDKEKSTEEQPDEEKPTEEKPTEEQPKGESEAAVLPAVGEKIAVVIAA